MELMLIPWTARAYLSSPLLFSTPSTLFCFSDKKQSAPLHEAAILGNVELIKLLLKHRANPNEPNVDLDTPLTLSLKRLTPTSTQYSACALLILNAGADPNTQNELGLAPLHYVAKN